MGRGSPTNPPLLPLSALGRDHFSDTRPRRFPSRNEDFPGIKVFHDMRPEDEKEGMRLEVDGTKCLDKRIIAEMLGKAAREAALLYGDAPLDYKGRRVTEEGVLNTGSSPHNAEVIAAVAANTPGPKMLDVGIAYGIYDVALSRLFDFEVYGLEHPDNIATYCRFPVQQGISVLSCDLHFDSIPFEKEAFDSVVASEIVEHLFISPKALFSRIVPVLKPGGRLVVTTPNFLSLRKIILMFKGFNPAAPFPEEVLKVKSGIQDPRVHPREYTLKEIRSALVASGFKIVSIYTVVDAAVFNVRFRSRIMRTLMRLMPGRGDRIVAIGEKK